VLAGAVAVADDALYERLRTTRRLTGMVAPADTAWLLLRGLKTLAVRVERQTATARDLAGRLRSHPAVVTVRYPGFGGLLAFEVANADAAHVVETGTRLIENATSLGGTVSKLEGRHRWEGDRIPTGLIRLSIGLESPAELWADLEQALARL
jgi:cystathionine gamma-synthase